MVNLRFSHDSLLPSSRLPCQFLFSHPSLLIITCGFFVARIQVYCLLENIHKNEWVLDVKILPRLTVPVAWPLCNLTSCGFCGMACLIFHVYSLGSASLWNHSLYLFFLSKSSQNWHKPVILVFQDIFCLLTFSILRIWHCAKIRISEMTALLFLFFQVGVANLGISFCSFSIVLLAFFLESLAFSQRAWSLLSSLLFQNILLLD